MNANSMVVGPALEVGEILSLVQVGRGGGVQEEDALLGELLQDGVPAYAKTENGETVVYKIPQIGLVESVIQEDELMTKEPFQVMVNARTDMSSIEVSE